jgi:predicted KAP-like P-loop ATPase
MDGDRPITRREDDRLGFTPVAEHLARAIADLPAAQGFVFGIEGKWGSGKSTLINLTVDSLKSYGDAAPEIILFSPWLVGGRDELLQNLFDELATAAVKIDPIEIDVPDDDASWWMKLRRTLSQDKLSEFQKKERLKKAIGQKLKSFGHVATTISKVTKLASTFGLPGAELASSAIDRSSEFAKELATGGSISKRKAALVDALKFLSRRIVVFVDDLDRLEPREASEVLRLISPSYSSG